MAFMETIIARETYVEWMKSCLEAWNQSDAELTASFYADTLDYRDPNTPGGIQNKSDFVRYLKILFRKWPRQRWDQYDVMPHEQPGCFSISYRFEFGNDKRTIRGYGIDRMEFSGDRIRLNHVYLNPELWSEWMRRP